MTVGIANFTNRVTETLEDGAAVRQENEPAVQALRPLPVVGPAGAARAAGAGRAGREGQDDSGVLPDDGRGDRDGCNQKSNRDPVTNYDQDDVEETLHSLRKKGAVILIEGSGRVARWKHTLYDWLKVSKVELAVMAELLLRGPQTEGELRARASRMEPLADLPRLAGDPRGTGARGAGAAICRRRARSAACSWRTGSIPPKSSSKVRQAFAGRHAGDDETPARLSTARRRSRRGTVARPGRPRSPRSRRGRPAAGAVDALAAEVRDLKSALGA